MTDVLPPGNKRNIDNVTAQNENASAQPFFSEDAFVKLSSHGLEMTSSTTLVLKNNQKEEDSLQKNKKKSTKSSILLVFSLWLFSSIFSATKADITPNIAGVTISFNIQDVLLILSAAWMLHRGLVSRSISMTLPWLFVTIYGIYYNHYKGLLRMIRLLKHSKGGSHFLPWIAISFVGFAIVVRLVLIMRIIQLTANMWYRKKLEKELSVRVK